VVHNDLYIKQATFPEAFHSVKEVVEGFIRYFEQKIKMIRKNVEAPEQDQIYPNISCKYHMDSFTPPSKGQRR